MKIEFTDLADLATFVVIASIELTMPVKVFQDHCVGLSQPKHSGST